MDGWTIFYWGWWISWSPFVGMFIAKISRGRTIRQFINGMSLLCIVLNKGLLMLCIEVQPHILSVLEYYMVTTDYHL